MSEFFLWVSFLVNVFLSAVLTNTRRALKQYRMGFELLKRR